VILAPNTAAQLWQYLGYLIGQGHYHIVLDLHGMILIDSAGVEVLARVSAWTRRKGGDLVLRSASAAVAEQLELARAPRATGAIPQLGADHRGPTTAPAAGPGPAADGGHPCPVRSQSWVRMSVTRRDSSAP